MKKSHKKGAIILLTAALSVVLIGITAMVVDLGYLYLKRNELQTAVNAAWLAGNDRLAKLIGNKTALTPIDKENIKSHILEVMSFNGFEPNKENTLSFSIDDKFCLKIDANSQVGLFFANIINISSKTVSANRHSKLSNIKVLPKEISNENQ